MQTLTDAVMFQSQEDRVEDNTEGHQTLEDGAGDQLGEKVVTEVRPGAALLVPGEDVVPGGVVLLVTHHPTVTGSLTPTLTTNIFLQHNICDNKEGQGRRQEAVEWIEGKRYYKISIIILSYKGSRSRSVTFKRPSLETEVVTD